MIDHTLKILACETPDMGIVDFNTTWLLSMSNWMRQCKAARLENPTPPGLGHADLFMKRPELVLQMLEKLHHFGSLHSYFVPDRKRVFSKKQTVFGGSIEGGGPLPGLFEERRVCFWGEAPDF